MGPWWRFFGPALASIRFGLALCVSPLIVFFVFEQVYDQDQDLPVLAFCFQSGFFWERTLGLVAEGMKKPSSQPDDNGNPADDGDVGG